MNDAKPMLSDATYNRLKWIVTIFLPALATFYFAVAAIWDLPAAEQVVGTLAAVATLGGVLLGVSTKQYNALDEAQKSYDGALVVNETDPMKDVYSLQIDVPLSELKNKAALNLRIRDEGSV